MRSSLLVQLNFALLTDFAWRTAEPFAANHFELIIIDIIDHFVRRSIHFDVPHEQFDSVEICVFFLRLRCKFIFGSGQWAFVRVNQSELKMCRNYFFLWKRDQVHWSGILECAEKFQSAACFVFRAAIGLFFFFWVRMLFTIGILF